jgi:2,5-diamino-6-(ribosylamino)-4(3H)-pyrimidinone 5'-phosphate reductase
MPPACGMARPRISINLAISADGKISSSPPRPSGWTSRADHARLLELRENADALLVGRGTLEADRMTLTVPGKSKQPLRCVVSRSGKLDPALPVLHAPGGDIHLLVTGELVGPVDSKVTVHQQTLAGFLEVMATEFEVRRLHCEGGGQLVRALAELDAIDEFHLTLAGHTLFGGLNAPTPTGVPGDFLPKSVAFDLRDFQLVADECFLSYVRRDPR